MNRKVISLLLAVLMLSGTAGLIACTDTADSKTPGDPANSNSQYADNLPEGLSFADQAEEQRTVTFAYVEGSNGFFTERSIVADADSSDKVDTAVYARNKSIEDRLGVTIDAIKVSDSFQGLRGAVEASLNANDPEYDIIAGYQYFDIGLAADGFLLNLNTLADDPFNAPYIDLSRDYWSSDYISALSYKDAIYWITGDLSLRFLGGMYCTFVNGDIYDRYLKETYGDIYQIAREGKWTLDKLAEMAALCYKDDGNDITDENDQLGFVLETEDPVDGMAFGSAIRFSNKNADGSISVILNNENTIKFCDKMYDIYQSNYYYAPQNSDSINQMTMFAQGNVAFTVNKIFQAEVYLREMENYYIIPTPKLNEDQQNYSTGIHDGCTIFGITYCSDAVPAAAALLEAMAAESGRSVTPEYIMTLL